MAKSLRRMTHECGRWLAKACLAALFASTACTPARPPDTTGAEISPAFETLAQFNRGAALLEQYRYAEAAQVFEQVVKAAPSWTAARFNLGLALLNMQEEAGATESLTRSEEIFQSILQENAAYLPARFCLGLIHQHRGDNVRGMECFRAVHQGDPKDLYTAHKYAETLIALDQWEPAVELLRHVIDLDPGFISAIYRLAMLYQRGGQRDEAQALFARFRELRDAELTGGTFAVANTYGTAGKYCIALGADSLPLRPPEPAGRRILLSPELKRLPDRSAAWTDAGVAVDVPGVAAGDLDGDGDIDLCLTGLGGDGATTVWLNDGTGAFTRSEVIATQGICPSLGDVDNDGDLDLWLGRSARDLYFVNEGFGRFTSVDLSGISLPEIATHVSRLLDIDSDGDLDVLAYHLAEGSVPAGKRARAVVGALYNNNRDGSFTDLSEKLGLAFADVAIAAVVCDDFDGDRDLDLIVFPQDGPPIAWINDRVWQHRLLPAQRTGLSDVKDVLSVTSGDPDGDGDRDLLIFTRNAIHLYVNTGDCRFVRHADFTQRVGRTGASGGQFVDIDNDGDLDILVADRARPDGTRGPALFLNERPRDRFTDAAEIDPGNLLAAVSFEGYASSIAADFTGNGRCDILLAPAGTEPFLIENVTPGGHWIAIDLQGTREQDGKSRSNNSAIGARVDVRTGLISQQHVVGTPSGPVASPPLRVHAGLGPHTTVDWLRITWPDAVLQAELELPADQVVKVVEIQRKVSSCPHLFAWNGSHVEFVSDFGGMGGLGYLVAPGVYPKPDSTEYVPVPNLQPRDDQYVLHVVEPIEEIVYLDEAKLLAVDHPRGTRIYPNEMMAVNAPPSNFEIFCIEDAIHPVQALDHRGADVTDAVRTVDRVYAGPTQIDPRFVGYAQDHFIDLDFGPRLSELDADARLVLFLHGWVHYAYSSTNFAAHQAGVRLRAPSIYVQRAEQWVELFHEVGYPAGIRHMMTLDVTGKLLPTDRRVRIVTNMELYWDQIFVAPVLTQAPLKIQTIFVESAELRFLGYPREYSPDGGQPDLYDYSQVDRAVPWKTMRGAYTRYGDVTTLLHEPDDCYVIMGPGEEVTLRFAADRLEPPAPGYERSFLLKTDSYCKDMDLYTAFPETVEPLPFHGMSGYPYGPDEAYPQDEKHQEYQRAFNTRIIH